MVKNLSAMQESQIDSWVGKIPWRREWQPILVFLPRKSHRQESLGSQRIGYDLAHVILSSRILFSQMQLSELKSSQVKGPHHQSSLIRSQFISDKNLRCLVMDFNFKNGLIFSFILCIEIFFFQSPSILIMGLTF